MLIATVLGKPDQFLMDMGANIIIITKPVAPHLSKKINVQWETDHMSSYFCEPQQVHFRRAVNHSFVLMADCRFTLLGQGLLHNLQAQFSFTTKEIILTTTEELPAAEVHVLIVIFLLQEEYHIMDLDKSRPS